MQILAVDIGTGTQDVLLFDSSRSPENCLKMVMPSPTLWTVSYTHLTLPTSDLV